LCRSNQAIKRAADIAKDILWMDYFWHHPNMIIPVSSLSFHLTSLDELKHTLNRFWEVKHNGISNTFSPEEKICEESFLQGVRRDEGYTVKPSTRQDKLNNLGESRDVALKRFLSMEKRLITQSSMYAYVYEVHAKVH